MSSKRSSTSTKAIKKLLRPLSGRQIAGVAAAFANYFEIDVTLVRVVLALTFIPGGFPGLFIYVLCWLLIPSEE